MDEVVNSPQIYKVILSGEGISAERNVTQDVARHILDILLGGVEDRPVRSQPVVLPAESAELASPRRGLPRFSLREFIEDCGARRNPDRILAIGEYIIEYEGAQDFGRDDVKARFRAAGEAVPSNYPRDFNWTISNGWIAEDPANADRFYVTRTGKDAITKKFSAEVIKASAQPTPRKRIRRSASDDSGSSGANE